MMSINRTNVLVLDFMLGKLVDVVQAYKLSSLTAMIAAMRLEYEGHEWSAC